MARRLDGKRALIYGGGTGLGLACAAGLLGMTRAMALDLAEHRVRVNAISPSLVLTELAQDILSHEADPAATLARREAQHPLGRLGHPESLTQNA